MDAKFVNKTMGFTEDSDPVRDMGIGLKPEEVSQKFALDFEKEFDQTLWFNDCSGFYDLPEGNVYSVGEESFTDESHPIYKLFAGEDHELLFAMNNKAAKEIDGKTKKWGWFYHVKGTAHYLKDAYDFKDVIVEICKIAGVTKSSLKKRIKKYHGYVTFLKKLDKYTV